MSKNNKPSIKTYALVGLTLSISIIVLSTCTKIPEDSLWRLLDEVQKQFFPDTIINEFIIKDQNKLDKRIESEVDRSIIDHSDKTKPEASGIIPIYIESPPDNGRAQQLLGGEMRLCAPWVPDCPIDNIVK